MEDDLRLAREAFFEADYESAAELLEEATGNFPEDANLRLMLGVCYEEMEDFENAGIRYREYLDMAPDGFQGSLVEDWAVFVEETPFLELEVFEELFRRVQKKTLKSAARLFHQKPELLGKELENEYLAIEYLFKLVNENLGALGVVKEYDGKSQKFVKIAIGGADPQYWEKFRGEIKKEVFNVEFEKVGNGNFVVEKCQTGGYWEIKSMMIALPASDEHKKLFEEILEDFKKYLTFTLYGSIENEEEKK